MQVCAYMPYRIAGRDLFTINAYHQILRVNASFMIATYTHEIAFFFFVPKRYITPLRPGGYVMYHQVQN
jgi:hypothetical protein